jgi:hypothetical protein
MRNKHKDVDLRSPKEIACLLGVTVHCLGNWWRADEGPTFITIGSRKVAYDMKDVASWLEAKKSNISRERRHLAGMDDAALIHHRDIVADRFRDTKILLDQENRRVLALRDRWLQREP